MYEWLQEATLPCMWQCTVSVDIDRSPEAVYRRLRDFTRHADFADGLAAVEQTSPGPQGVGTQFRATERIPGKYVSFAEITGLEEPGLIAWRAWVPGVMRTRWQYRLERQGTATRLTQVCEWEPAGPLGWLMLNLHRKRHVPAENRRTLQRVKAVLEAEAPAVAAS